MHVKKGDNVIVLSGKDKGKSGTITRAIPKLGKIVIEGVNVLKKHQRARKQGEKGQILNVSMPIDASNVKLSGEKKAEPKKAKVVKAKTVKAK